MQKFYLMKGTHHRETLDDLTVRDPSASDLKDLAAKEYFIFQSSRSQNCLAARYFRDHAAEHPKTRGLELMVILTPYSVPSRPAAILLFVYKDMIVKSTAETDMSIMVAK